MLVFTAARSDSGKVNCFFRAIFRNEDVCQSIDGRRSVARRNQDIEGFGHTSVVNGRVEISIESGIFHN